MFSNTGADSAAKFLDNDMTYAGKHDLQSRRVNALEDPEVKLWNKFGDGWWLGKRWKPTENSEF